MQVKITLNSAIDSCQHRELVRAQNSQSTSNIDAVTHKNNRGRGRSHRQGHHRGQSHGNDQSKQPDSATCDRCGYVKARSHSTSKYPAANTKCRHCHKTGHFESVCHQKKKCDSIQQPTNMEDRSLDIALEKMFMGSIQAQYKSLTHDNTPPLYETLEVNSTQLRFKLDSGADVSIISKKLNMTAWKWIPH